MQTSVIEHEGVVETFQGDVAVVLVLQHSACSSCAAAGLCRSSESKEKRIEVFVEKGIVPVVGQRVLVQGTVRQGYKAVVLAYGIPLLFIVMILSLFQYLQWNELTGALAAFVFLSVYYAILHLFRSRLQKELSFKLTKILQ